MTQGQVNNYRTVGFALVGGFVGASVTDNPIVTGVAGVVVGGIFGVLYSLLLIKPTYYGPKPPVRWL